MMHGRLLVLVLMLMLRLRLPVGLGGGRRRVVGGSAEVARHRVGARGRRLGVGLSIGSDGSRSPRIGCGRSRGIGAGRARWLGKCLSPGL